MLFQAADLPPGGAGDLPGLASDDAEARAARLVEQVAQGMQRLNTQICQGPVQASYPLSAFQKMFLLEANRVTFYMIDFHEPIEVPLIERALTDVVGLQSLMRSRLRRNRLRRLIWEEFAAPTQALALPLVDLSDCAPPLQGELIGRLMAAENRVDFDAVGGVMFRVMLVRLDRCRHSLFFNLDHSIFDNMSGQVLRRQLLSRYRQLLAGSTAPMEPVKSFHDYLESSTADRHHTSAGPSADYPRLHCRAGNHRTGPGTGASPCYAGDAPPL